MMKKNIAIILGIIFSNFTFGQLTNDTIKITDSLKVIFTPELKATLDYANYMDSIAKENIIRQKITSNDFWESGQIKVMYEQDLENGLKDYDKAIELDSNNIKVYNDRAFVYLNLGDTSKALDNYNKAISISDTIAALFLNRAYLYNELQELEKALEDINNSLKLEKESEDALYLKGKILYKLKDYKNSILQFKEVLKISPNTIGSYHWLGLNYLKINDKENYCEYFRLAFKNNYRDSKNYIDKYCE